jgi:hypothetical protein
LFPYLHETFLSNPAKTVKRLLPYQLSLYRLSKLTIRSRLDAGQTE